MTSEEERSFEFHRDNLIRIFSGAVSKWANENDGPDGIPFLLAVEWAYMVGATVTAKTCKQDKEQLIQLAEIVWSEGG
jgi:hypothetical protein